MDKINIRLYWGENYCLKPRMIMNAMKNATVIGLKKIHLFPGDVYNETKKLISDLNHINENQIVLGNGIDNMINLITRCYVKKGTIVGGFSPSYNIYQIATNNYLGTFKTMPIGIGQYFSAKELFNKIKKFNVFFIAYPNNPTGQYCINKIELEKLLKKYKGILVIDECYYGIGNKTVINLTKNYSNLIVLRSFSKGFGLAGLRFGYVVSNEKIINKLNKIHSEIELDSVNIFSHLVSQSILPYTNLLLEKFNQFKKEFIKKLISIKNIKIIPTWTSFVLIKLNNHQNTNLIINKLTNYGIYVKETKNYENFPKDVLMFAIPEKKYWNYFFGCLTKVVNS